VALRQTKDLKTILGPITFDETGQAPGSFTLFQFVNGERQIKRESMRSGERYIELK
jgi:hypothetical protein